MRSEQPRDHSQPSPRRSALSHDAPYEAVFRDVSMIFDTARESATRSVNGLILCSEKDEGLARYALDGLPNNVMAGEYRVTLPEEKVLAAELDRTRQAMELRGTRGAVSIARQEK